MNIDNIEVNTLSIISKLWPWWINDADRTAMQFLADMCASMNALGYLSIDDLYVLSESEVIERFRNCDNYLSECFKKFEQAEKCYRVNSKIEGKYCINVRSKRRFINPLVQEGNVYGRIYDLSEKAKKNIDDYMSIPNDGYTYLDFEFIPLKSIQNVKKLGK